MSKSTPSLGGHQLLNRRRFLSRLSSGMGGIALGALLAEQNLLADQPTSNLGVPHHPAKAKRVVHIFCTGAVSHLDTWDYKPELIKRHGEPLPGGEKLRTFQGENGNLARSPWTFKPRGESGKMTSDLLPRLGALADEMCFVHSLTSKTNTHGPGEIFLSTGFTAEGYPSLGSWVSYALGTANKDMPTFVNLGRASSPVQLTGGYLGAGVAATPFQPGGGTRLCCAMTTPKKSWARSLAGMRWRS